MFLHLSVILLTGGGGLCMMSLPLRLPGPYSFWGVSVRMGFLWKGGLWEKGVSLIRGSL